MLVCALLCGCAGPKRIATAPATSVPFYTTSPAPSVSLGPAASTLIAVLPTTTVSAAAQATGLGTGQGITSLTSGGVQWLGYDRDVIKPDGGGLTAGQDGVKEGHIQTRLSVPSTGKLTGFDVLYSSSDFVHDFTEGGTALILLDGRQISNAVSTDLSAGTHVIDIYLYTLLNGSDPVKMEKGKIGVWINAVNANGERELFTGTVQNPK
jgi:hypothetical protein